MLKKNIKDGVFLSSEGGEEEGIEAMEHFGGMMELAKMHAASGKQI
jgi:hypothetical protein